MSARRSVMPIVVSLAALVVAIYAVFEMWSLAERVDEASARIGQAQETAAGTTGAIDTLRSEYDEALENLASLHEELTEALAGATGRLEELEARLQEMGDQVGNVIDRNDQTGQAEEEPANTDAD